ncbi:hypothetical protein [Niallia nealsonii]|uniref:Uncharacterized protein n=1 Tax=Niallia nealsonii TaxID=115979 RepID=A0A2N0YZ62_9BACI|nr:hypothetical protein [Niallia nealsonii]PKG22541.1 hypothetical protein CWS01_16610 [Niallia nealsonii]
MFSYTILIVSATLSYKYKIPPKTRGALLQMINKEAIELAKKIVELDLQRDEIWENFAAVAGDYAHDLLRIVQNS